MEVKINTITEKIEAKKLILSIYNISEYLYCEKSCCYKIFNFEEKQEQNTDLIKGRLQHETVHRDDKKYKNGLKQLTNLSVFSRNYSIRGKLDMLEIRNNLYIPIEYKKGKITNFLNHRVQLCLQVLCLEEMYNTEIKHAFLYFIQVRKRKIVSINNNLRKFTITMIKEIRLKLMLNNLNLFKKNKNELCEKCSFFNTCMPFLTDK